MPNTHTAETLLIEGPDAMSFAHAQFSSSVKSLLAGQWQFSAWLDPQGRVRVLFHLARIGEERYLLLLRGGSAADMVNSLQHYVFRAKLTLSAQPPRQLTTGPALPLHAISDAAESIAFGCDTHSLQVTPTGSVQDDWCLLQLREGWPWLPASTLNKLLPAALSLQRLQAVAIDKGCYPGQEIVARLHFRSAHKWHLHRGTLSQAAEPGLVLHIDDRDVGCVLEMVVSDLGNEVLLVLKDEVMQQATPDLACAFDGQIKFRHLASWPA